MTLLDYLIGSLTRFRAWLQFCASCAVKAVGLKATSPRHRAKIHLGVITIIGIDLVWAGFKLADLGFLLLSLLIEVESRTRPIERPTIAPVTPDPIADPDPYQIDHDFIGVNPDRAGSEYLS